MSRDEGESFGWVAHPPPGSDEHADDERHVAGLVIRFMWDHGCVVPLWDEEGPLPEDPDWLAAELGLSRELVEDMAAWASDEDALPMDPAHTRAAELLFARLQAEIPARFTLVNRQSRTP